MKQSLDRIAQAVMDDPEFDSLDFNWPALRYEHTTWMRARLQAELAPSTANKCIAAMKGVLKESWRLEYMTAEDFHRAVDLKTVTGLTLPPGRALKMGEMREYFKCCAKDRSIGAVLDAALFAALAGAGLRRTEAVSLDLEHFFPDDQRVRVRGKGKKERDVPIQKTAVAAITLWANVRGLEPGPLFCPVRKNGTVELRRMTDQALYRRLQRRALKASIPSFTPHDLRRTYASGMLEAGADVFAVQKLLGQDQPIWVQYGQYLQQLLFLDFGLSLRKDQSVSTLLSDGLPERPGAASRARGRCRFRSSLWRSAAPGAGKSRHWPVAGTAWSGAPGHPRCRAQSRGGGESGKHPG